MKSKQQNINTIVLIILALVVGYNTTTINKQTELVLVMSKSQILVQDAVIVNQEALSIHTKIIEKLITNKESEINNPLFIVNKSI